MPTESRTPDAVLIPDKWKGAGNALERGFALFRHAERLLDVDPTSSTEKVHVRIAGGGGHMFCTKSPSDTMFFPIGHHREGQARYHWERQDDESVLGFYVDDEAREACSAKA